VATERQRSANRKNAALSTGPKTAKGKAVASANARSHGILSTAVVLPSESQSEFDALLSTLIAELNAMGTLEMALVERIAIAMWRQKRLVAVERNEWGREADAVMPTANDAERSRGLKKKETRDLSYQSPYFQMVDLLLSAEDLDQFEAEVRSLERAAGLTNDAMEEHFPLVHRHFFGPEIQKGWGGPNVVLISENEVKSLQIALTKGIAMKLMKLAAEKAGRSGLAMPKNTDTLTRYQSALDNEWYKAMRALREAQAARLRTVGN